MLLVCDVGECHFDGVDVLNFLSFSPISEGQVFCFAVESICNEL